MGISGFVLLQVIGPGLIFLLVAGKTNEVRSPSGWLLAFPVGLALNFFVACGFSLRDQTILATLNIREPFISVGYVFYVYLVAFVLGGVWRAFRISNKLAFIWLHAEKSFRGDGELFVSKNLLEHFLCICYISKVQPIFRVIMSSGVEFTGICVKYQWTEPQSLLICKKNSGSLPPLSEAEKVSFNLVKLSDVQVIFLKNWAEVKSGKPNDPGKYLRLWLGSETVKSLKLEGEMVQGKENQPCER